MTTKKKWTERDHEIEELRMAVGAAKMLPAMLKAARKAELARDVASAEQFDGTEASIDSALAELFESIGGLIDTLDRAAAPFIQRRQSYTGRWSHARWAARNGVHHLVPVFEHWATTAGREKRTAGQVPAIEALTTQLRELLAATQETAHAEYVTEAEHTVQHGLSEAHVGLGMLDAEDNDAAVQQDARERLARVRALMGKDA